jgi:hypothetical protein
MKAPQKRGNRLKLAGACVVTLLAAPLFATTVIVIRTPQGIVLSADSLADEGNFHPNICKIEANENQSMFFTLAGFVKHGLKFSAFALAEKAAAEAEVPQEAATKFASSAFEPFQRAVLEVKRTNPVSYKKILTGPEPLQIIFAAVQNNTPLVALVVFKVRDQGGDVSFEQQTYLCPGDGCPKGGRIFLLGEHTADDAYMQNPSFRVDDPVAVARQLVEIEVQASPDKVGRPISILKVTREGPSWIDRGMCP